MFRYHVGVALSIQDKDMVTEKYQSTLEWICKTYGLGYNPFFPLKITVPQGIEHREEDKKEKEKRYPYESINLNQSQGL